MEAIHILRRFTERFRETKRDIHIVFIDLEKAYDRITKEVIRQVLEKKHVHKQYIDVSKRHV